MKIIDIIKNASKPIFSFEFFPPKTSEGETKLIGVISELKKLQPAFVSVTYGAGGSTRDKTFEICDIIQNQFSITTMCHYTCVGSSQSEIFDNLQKIESKNIKNIIALRGDPPKDAGKFIPHPNGFANATELIKFIKSKNFDFGIAGGCYPEKHPDSPTLDRDIDFLKNKVDTGAEFLVTQLFFDNNKYFDFLNLAKQKNIHVPIIPGIMPITSFSQIARFKEMADCSIPDSLIRELELVKDDKDEFLKKSIDFTTNQCEELIKNGSKGIHFYTLNQSKSTVEIMKLLL